MDEGGRNSAALPFDVFRKDERGSVFCSVDVEPSRFQAGVFQTERGKIPKGGVYDVRWKFRWVRPNTLVRSCLERLCQPDLRWFQRRLTGVALEMTREFLAEGTQAAHVDAKLELTPFTTTFFATSEYTTVAKLQHGHNFSLQIHRVHGADDTLSTLRVEGRFHWICGDRRS